MELPLGTEAGRKATHDFLSLYSSSTAHTQQDPVPPQGSCYLKTHDFLQPLEGAGKNVMTSRKEEVVKGGRSGVGRGPVEHVLPGGIGTYSISYFNQQRVEGALFSAETSSSISNCSSFTLWDESALKKGKTGKEKNIVDHREAGVNVVGAQWPPMIENATNFTALSSSQPSSSQKNQSFMDMITSAKNDQEEDDDEGEDEFIIKREPSSHSKANLSVKVEAKSIDQKPNTPRSKHSATEQRRRSKINDRFQKLREIIPNSEQKRDKASFLLEVIDYIQFLQEKVNRFENSNSVWNHEPSKMTQWRNSHIAEGFLANADSPPPSVFATKFDEKKGGGHNLVDSDLSTGTTLNERIEECKVKNMSVGRRSIDSPKQASDMDRTMTWPLGASGNKKKEQEVSIESGTINISSVYSQGLLNTLTKALQSSGVDLSQASISVQIDIGKRANGVPKGDEGRGGEEFGHALKKLRTS
ncbi:hypothetical protein ACS0TY_031286 [Phlomoides rotata]